MRQCLSRLTDVHWEAVKRIVRFAKGAVSARLTVQCSSSTLLSVFLDADWIGYVDDRRSNGSFVAVSHGVHTSSGQYHVHLRTQSTGHW